MAGPLARGRLDQLQFSWLAADGAIRTNTRALGENDILYGVTLGLDTSNSGPLEAEVYLLNPGPDLLEVMLAQGSLWNGDVDGQISWFHPVGLGPFTVPHSVRVSVQNFSGATVTIAESILRGTVP